VILAGIQPRRTLALMRVEYRSTRPRPSMSGICEKGEPGPLSYSGAGLKAEARAIPGGAAPLVSDRKRGKLKLSVT
jgi:hypothetical protein